MSASSTPKRKKSSKVGFKMETTKNGTKEERGWSHGSSLDQENDEIILMRMRSQSDTDYSNPTFTQEGTIYDPNDPMTDGYCRFINLPTKLLDLVISRIPYPKDKMRLEMVCRKLYERVRLPDVWIYDTVLGLRCDLESKFGYNVLGQDFALLINGSQFSLEKAPSALNSLLQRTPSVLLKSGRWGQPHPREGKEAKYVRLINEICQVIVENKVSFSLHSLVLFDGAPLDTTWFLGAIRTCGVETLEEMQCRPLVYNGLRCTGGFNDTVWSFVGACTNLREFHFQAHELSDVHSKVMGIALRNAKKLEEINLNNIKSLDDTELAKICNKCQYLKVIGIKHCDSVNPVKFGASLEPEARNRIISIGFGLDKTNSKHKEFTRNIPTFFPNVRVVAFSTKHQFWPEEEVVKTITTLVEGFKDYSKMVTVIMPTKQAGVISKRLGRQDGPCDRVTVELDHYKCVKNHLIVQVDTKSGWKMKPPFTLHRFTKNIWRTIHPDQNRPPAMTMIQPL